MEQGLIEFLTGTRQLNQANWDAWIAEFRRIGADEWERNALAFADEAGFLVNP
jgi:putative aldouronate transport system substrate-binding protein